MQADTQDTRGIRTLEDLVLDRCDHWHRELVREDHEVADLFKDNLPDDVAQAGGVKGVGDAAQVEVNLGRCEEVNLE